MAKRLAERGCRRRSQAANTDSHLEERTLHIVDVENLCGDGFPSRSAAVETLASYAAAARLKPGDFGFASANRHLVRELAHDLPMGIRWVPAGIGPEAADRALIDTTDVDFVARRYDRIVIGSGDHAFTELAGRLVAAGREVVAVAVDGSLSTSLREAVKTVVLMPPHDSDPCVPTEAPGELAPPETAGTPHEEP